MRDRARSVYAPEAYRECSTLSMVALVDRRTAVTLVQQGKDTDRDVRGRRQGTRLLVKASWTIQIERGEKIFP